MTSDDQAYVVLPSVDLQADITFYTRQIGLQLNAVYPSEQPTLAELSGNGLSLMLDNDFKGEPGELRIKSTSGDQQQVRSPSGTVITWQPAQPPSSQSLGRFDAEICTLRNTSPWIVGKAGTHTRELIPSRLGGALLASHIRIPNGGPVADRVHFHTSEFQLVFCVRGWIKLVYEDQGEPITLSPGDCVTQPPHIRHKVMETSNGLEVIEISLPAEHITAIDSELSLPNGRIESHRQFHGQRFCHFQQAKGQWGPHKLPGFRACDTGVALASGGLAGANLLQASGTPQRYSVSHTASALFNFVLAGSVRVNRQLLVAGDAYTLPPNEPFMLADMSADVTVLELSLPGTYAVNFQG